MEKKVFQMEQEGKLDEGFLAEVSAQLRQVSTFCGLFHFVLMVIKTVLLVA
ncbi:hypothetical protein Gohar_004033 [Gossypium harknessii]|uniref:Uncharacterized protein n=1 Tax=Gossypium harknessii TaxID=34285 RepID=A0A7J9H3T7_9ROSI|nr:hypothetical protein [Gossypium harknessii]